jgi:hypothetical protein
MRRVSRFLSIECEWIDQPLAADVLERRTWARIALTAAGRSVSRIWDRDAQAERASLYLPAFPLAQWIIANWWAIQYEPVPPNATGRFLSSEGDWTAHQFDWLQRHCLRAAESGLMLPNACFYSDGRNVVIDWSADDQDAYPRMTGYFVESGGVCLDSREVRRELREFVANVILRIEDINDVRAIALKRNWEAIVAADPDEEAFCRAAGRMGLDPYALSTWEPDVLELLEGSLGNNLDQPIVVDFLEATDKTTAVSLWQWVNETRVVLDLQGSAVPASLRVPITRTPAKMGYQLAMRVREAMGSQSQGPLDQVADAATVSGIKPLLFTERNHLSSASVKAAVGWRAGIEPVVAGPTQTRKDNARFLEARALFHAAFACQSGPRLITESRTWDQQASRAFAAELLAPRHELRERLNDSEPFQEPDQFEANLAAEYGVSTKVIRHQLENVGIILDVA